MLIPLSSAVFLAASGPWSSVSPAAAVPVRGVEPAVVGSLVGGPHTERFAVDEDDADVYVRDVDFALEELEKNCGHFFKLKEIDWDQVRKEFQKAAKDVRNDADHLWLLMRLLARLKDGHCEVQPARQGQEMPWPTHLQEPVGAGWFLCKVGKKIYVKTTWNDAEAAGLKPGMQVMTIDDKPVQKWLEERQAELCDWRSFSTDHQAFFFTCHQGLAFPAATRLELEVKDLKGKAKKRTITYTRGSYAPQGPAFYPDDVQGTNDVNWGHTEEGFGYVQLRRCKSDLAEQLDQALADLGDVPGMIVDFRGNSGGTHDDGVLGRFVPKGETLSFGKAYPSAGEHPYAGPVVVIVDATVRSAGETLSGIFKEDGRAYMIGESPTAGMASGKTTLQLPSGKFTLYVSVSSNKGRFNGGAGIEGIGVIPHETLEYDPKDLANGVDTFIARAEALLKKYPKNKVPYDATKYQGR